MAACPHCRFDNPEAVEVCVRCGGDVFALPPLSMSAPLPAPMTEPIDPPSKPPPDSKPLPAKPALTVPFGGNSAVVTLPDPPRRAAGPDSTPAPVTVRDLPASDPPSRGRLAPGGTVPAHPGLPGHPMNEAAVQLNESAVQPPPTIPATDPADHPPTPVPVPQVRPKLVVLRGLKINAEFPVYEGRNTIGRFADKPVDIDLMSQESVEQIWCSRQHAAVIFEKGVVAVEDLNSLNGTWLNGTRIQPGQPRQLKPGDVVQIGTVQLRLVLE